MSSLSLTADTSASPSSEMLVMDGGMLFWAGLSYGLASLAQYLVLTGHVQLLHPAMMGLIWMGASGIFVMFGFVFKVGSDPLVLKRPSVKRFRAVWGTLIIGAAVVIAALMIMMVRFGAGAEAAFVISPVAISIYGIGWRVAALMTGKRWPNLLSLGCFAGAIGLALLAGQPEQSLAYAVCLTFFAVLPGLALMLRQNAN
ncbi:hypothetical protein [Asticcacaulis benevestitus]|nr:hypothetical protein [Asticcacaulis benevestitus]